MRRTKRNRSDGRILAHRIFGESFYENFAAILDEQIAEMMKEPAFREMVRGFNYRMFEMMTRIAAKQMRGRR